MPNISPVVLKGAIVSLDPNIGIPTGLIMFQYNPDEVTRSLKPQSVGPEPDRTEIFRLKGPPIEPRGPARMWSTISFCSVVN